MASTIAFSPDFEFTNVPPGNHLGAAFGIVQVPRGFRPPDPDVRPLDDFDVRAGRYNDNAIEQFNTIELFGVYTGGGNSPAIIDDSVTNIEISLRGQARTRQQLLRIVGIEINGAPFDPDNVDLVDVLAGNIDILIRFDKGLCFEQGFAIFEAALNGAILQDFTLEEDNHAVRFAATLLDGDFVGLSIFGAEAADGSRLDRPLDVGFGTAVGDLVVNSVSGSVTLETQAEDGSPLTGDDADVIDEATVFLIQENVTGGEPVVVSVGTPDAAGTFTLSGLLPLRYQLFTEVVTASGQTLKAVLDADTDGVPDVLDLAASGDVTDADISVTVVVATTLDEDTGVTVKSAPSGGNSTAIVSFDLNTALDNQGVVVLSGVEARQTVDVDLYVDGVTEMSGFGITMRYGADVIEFVDATDEVEGFANFLKQDGRLGFFLPPIIRTPLVEYGGGLLTGSISGGRFMSRFSFLVLDGFTEGAQIHVEEVLVLSPTGLDILNPDISAKVLPPPQEEQQKGIVSFDFDTTVEDQELFHKGFVEPGTLLEFDVYLNTDLISEDFVDLENFSISMEFDPDQVLYLGYEPSTVEEINVLLAGGGNTLPLPVLVSDRTIDFGNSLVLTDSDAAPDDPGLAGRLTFLTTDEFTETDFIVYNYGYKQLDGEQQQASPVIFGRISTGEIQVVGPGSGGDGGPIGGGGTATAAAVDFDGNGIVNLFDFFRFTGEFSNPVTELNTQFDITGDGIINLFDFFAFIPFFNQTVAKAVVEEDLPTTEGV